MKYEMHGLVLVMTPQTREEQTFINMLDKMDAVIGCRGTDHAGATWEEGRRAWIGIVFKEPKKKEIE